MQSKIYYITRTFAPYQSGGGPLMRKGAVELLRQLGWNVVVVMPNYGGSSIVEESGIIQIPFQQIPVVLSVLERLGCLEDYLDSWVKRSLEYLKSKITRHDIVFATSGGELGTIKLGALLKDQLQCKLVVNFRDPLNYSKVHGLKVDRWFHVSREKQEAKYLSKSDLVLTSSESLKTSLCRKYPTLRIENNYFGFLKASTLRRGGNERTNKKLRIAYTGSMLSHVQAPEILYQVFQKMKNRDAVELFYIGNFASNRALLKIKDENVHFIKHLPHDEYQQFMIENVDVGAVTLARDYYGACVPSKIYEYINLGIPIIAGLPDGDARGIINDHGFGIAVHQDDILEMAHGIDRMCDEHFLASIRDNILRERLLWSMSSRINDVHQLLLDLSETAS